MPEGQRYHDNPEVDAGGEVGRAGALAGALAGMPGRPGCRSSSSRGLGPGVTRLQLHNHGPAKSWPKHTHTHTHTHTLSHTHKQTHAQPEAEEAEEGEEEEGGFVVEDGEGGGEEEDEFGKKRKKWERDTDTQLQAAVESMVAKVGARGGRRAAAGERLCC